LSIKLPAKFGMQETYYIIMWRKREKPGLVCNVHGQKEENKHFLNLKIGKTRHIRGVELVNFWHTDSLRVLHQLATTKHEIKRELDSSNQLNYKVRTLNYCFVV
jgi:hypothetical protein